MDDGGWSVGGRGGGEREDDERREGEGESGHGRHNDRVDDPYVILGVPRGAPLEEVTSAWRRLAKEWHPDLRGDANAVGRMVQLNAAYEAIRADRTGRPRPPGTRSRGGTTTSGHAEGATAGARRAGDAGGAAAGARRAGWWLAPPVRAALGPELLSSLREGEQVRLLAHCHAGGSWALLALTEGRLLWLLDDLVLGRVRSLPLSAVEAVSLRAARPWRRSPGLRVRGNGHVVIFRGLTPHTAEQIAAAIRRAAPAR